MTTQVEKSIEVDVPLSAAYNQWTQFEEFPQFMGGVTEVRQLGDNRMHWVAEIAGVKREWDAVVLEQIPDEKIAWAATSGATNAGAVRFAPLGAGSTQVTLSLEFEAEGLVEQVGETLHIVERQAVSDLNKFKSFIESRGSETGAWRGSVNPGAMVGTPGADDAAPSRGDSGKPEGSHSGITPKTVAAAVAATAVAATAAAALKHKSGEDEATAIETAEDRVVVVQGGPEIAPVGPGSTVPRAVNPALVDTTVEEGAAPVTEAATMPFVDLNSATTTAESHRSVT